MTPQQINTVLSMLAERYQCLATNICYLIDTDIQSKMFACIFFQDSTDTLMIHLKDQPPEDYPYMAVYLTAPIELNQSLQEYIKNNFWSTPVQFLDETIC